MDEIRTAFSVIAVIVSSFSLYFTRRFWLQTYRPIITAEIVENSSGVGAALFDLIVHNSGSRPAINIKLCAKKENIEKILSKNATLENKDRVIEVFAPSNKIALLLNGKEAKTAFFSFCNISDHNLDILEYESELPICIYYEDIESRKYKSKITLFIRGVNGFSGSIWNDE
jgi:hypothetical protein